MTGIYIGVLFLFEMWLGVPAFSKSLPLLVKLIHSSWLLILIAADIYLFRMIKN